MSTTLVVVPPEDAPFIARLARILAKRLVHGTDTVSQRQGLMRALFCLQRLPVLLPDLNLSIAAGHCQLQIDSQHCGFVSYTEDWHTEFRIQYFAGSTHCIDGFEFREGEERIAAAMWRLDDLEASLDKADELSVEDYSKPGAADEPPIGDFLECLETFDEP